MAATADPRLAGGIARSLGLVVSRVAKSGSAHECNHRVIYMEDRRLARSAGDDRPPLNIWQATYPG